MSSKHRIEPDQVWIFIVFLLLYCCCCSRPTFALGKVEPPGNDASYKNFQLPFVTTVEGHPIDTVLVKPQYTSFEFILNGISSPSMYYYALHSTHWNYSQYNVTVKYMDTVNPAPELDEVLQDIHCLTHNFDFHPNVGIWVTWTHTNSTNDVINQFETIFTADETSNKTFIFTNYLRTDIINDTSGLHVGSSLYVNGTEAYRLPLSYSTNVTSSLNSGNVNRNGTWMLRLDQEVQYTWEGMSNMPIQCGGKLNGSSGTLMSGGYPHNFVNFYDCKWEINVPAVNKVILRFSDIDIVDTKNCEDSFIEVVDNSNGQMIDKICGSTLPDEIISFSNSISVQFYSGTQTIGQRFYATWDSKTHDCGGDFIASVDALSGQLTSPLYPSNYTNHLDCVWRIRVLNMAAITLSFSDFDIMDSSDCSQDYLQVIDGDNDRQIGTFCGSSLPDDVSFQTNSFVVRLHTDGNGTGHGFVASWSFNPPSDCGGIMKAWTGHVSSPGYPGSYATNLDCVWKIISPSSNHNLSLSFSVFNLALTGGCNSDFLEVIDNNNNQTIEKKCGSLSSLKITTSTNSLAVRFVTDGNFSSQNGFQFSWLAGTNRDMCGGYHISSSGVFTSPRHPSSYNDDDNCHWIIAVPKGRTIQLSFNAFHLESDFICRWDRVTVLDGFNNYNVSGRLCGTSLPGMVSSFTNSIKVKFRTDGSNRYSGFNISWSTAQENSCIKEFFTMTGNFTSPGYPDNYDNDLRCAWKINVPKGMLIRLQIYDKNINCSDFLKIIDGATLEQIDNTCGSSPRIYRSSSNIMNVIFYTNHEFIGRGFAASWSSYFQNDDCGGEYIGWAGYITTPTINFRSTECVWKISVPSNVITSFRFNTSSLPSINCGYNYFEIIDLWQVNRVCGSNRLAMTKNITSVSVRLNSFQSSSRHGLSIPWSLVMPMSGSDENCGGEFSSSSGLLTSPNYPSKYNNDQDCVWRINVPFGHSVVLEFSAFYVEDSTDCMSDFFQVIDNGNKQTSEKLCGSSIPGVITSLFNNFITLRFFTDYSVTETGFSASWSKRPLVTCGGEYNGLSGQFSSPLYPNNYTNNLDCVWTITSTAGAIALNFINFDVGTGTDCDNDYVELIDNGDNLNNYSYCGSSIPDKIQLRSNNITVRLYTDGYIPHQGFFVSWVTETIINMTTREGHIFPSNSSVHDVLLGDTEFIECVVEGGIPTVFNLTLNCGGVTNTTTDLKLSVSFHITKDLQGTMCECSLATPADCHPQVSRFTLNVAHGPITVEGAIEDNEMTFSVCHAIKAYCEMNRTSVHPIPSVIFQERLGKKLDLVNIDTLPDMYRFNFSFQSFNTGAINLVCVANNTIYSHIGSKREIAVFINETNLQVKTEDVTVLPNNSLHWVLEGEMFNVECGVAGGIPPVLNLTMNCGGLTNTTMATTSSVGFQVTKNLQNTTCECLVTTPTGCYQELKRFTLLVAHGPTSVEAMYEVPKKVMVCRVVYCEVNRTDVHPMPSVILQGLVDGYLSPFSSDTLSDVYRFSFSYVPLYSGTAKFTCMANNFLYQQVGARHETTFFVNAPFLKMETENGDALSNGTVHDVFLGETLNVECAVKGQRPKDMNTTITCGGAVKTNIGAQSSISVQITKNHHGAICECTTATPSGCSHHPIQFTLNVAYGPTVVDGTAEDADVFYVCHDINAYCEVNRTDVYPMTSVILKLPHGGYLAPDDWDTLSDVYRFNFSFTPLMSGATNVVCMANNTMFDHIGTRQQIAIFVNETETTLEMATEDGNIIFNNSVHDVLLGKMFNPECIVGGIVPPILNMTLRCGGITNSTTGVKSSVGIQVTKGLHGVMCECSVTTPSGCYHQTTQYSLNVAYGPTIIEGKIEDAEKIFSIYYEIKAYCEVNRTDAHPIPSAILQRSHGGNVDPDGPTAITVGPTPISAFDLCPGENTNMTIYCQMDKNDVHPLPNVFIQGLFDHDLKPFNSTTSGNMIQYHFQFRPTVFGVHPLACFTTNSIFNDVNSKHEFTYLAREPPVEAPKLFVNGEIFTERTVKISLGEQLDILCQVEGGHPSVSSVVLDFQDTVNETEGTESSIQFQVKRSTNQAVCKCRANHISGCYPNTTELSILVWEPTSIITYTINAQRNDIKMDDGYPLDFLCEAEGIPLPKMSIHGQFSGRSLPVEEVTVNFYTKRVTIIKSMACDESDVYLCTADNGVPTVRPLTVLIFCKPQLVTRGANQIQTESSPITQVGLDGITALSFDIICRPKPQTYRLYKIFSSGNRQKRALSEVAIDDSFFKVSYSDVNVNQGKLDVQFFDDTVTDRNEYKLVVDNGHGTVDIPFETELGTEMETSNTANSESGVDNITNPNVLSLVAIGAICIILMMIVVTVYYLRWFCTDISKNPKNDRHTIVEDSIVDSSAHSRPDSLFWRRQRFE